MSLVYGPPLMFSFFIINNIFEGVEVSLECQRCWNIREKS